jgi:hypothetical protein
MFTVGWKNILMIRSRGSTAFDVLDVVRGGQRVRRGYDAPRHVVRRQAGVKTTLTTGMSMLGKMSVGVRKAPPEIMISSAMTMKV